MSFNRFFLFKLFLWINLTYLSYCQIDNTKDGYGNTENITTRNPRQLNSMHLNYNQLKEINSLISASMELLKEGIKLLIIADMNDSNKKGFDVNEIKCSDNRLPENCYEVNKCHSNVYSIMIPKYSDLPFPVSCDLKTLNGGWTVIQRRQDGSENFYRNWTDYVEGFGKMTGEFFIGLKKLHALTTHGKPQELHIVMEDFEQKQKYANYKKFEVGPEKTEFKLTIGNYSGTAGDSLAPHNNHTFSTRDHGQRIDCAGGFRGAWWYHNCHSSNLNGLYLRGEYNTSQHAQGIVWSDFRGYDYSLKFVQMMIRPITADD